MYFVHFLFVSVALFIAFMFISYTFSIISFILFYSLFGEVILVLLNILSCFLLHITSLQIKLNSQRTLAKRAMCVYNNTD